MIIANDVELTCNNAGVYPCCLKGSFRIIVLRHLVVGLGAAPHSSMATRANTSACINGLLANVQAIALASNLRFAPPANSAPVAHSFKAGA